MCKQYLILSVIIYSNVSALNGAYLKVSGWQYIQPAFIIYINLFLKSHNANTNFNCRLICICPPGILNDHKSIWIHWKNIERNCVNLKSHYAAFL